MSIAETVNVVLAHGAWADGSSWSRAIARLKHHSLDVIAAPLPLTTLADDVAALDRAMARTEGPVVPSSHTYAGAVISSWTSPRLRSLVFINSLTPDEGETVANAFFREQQHPKTPALEADQDGLVWLPDTAFRRCVCSKRLSGRTALAGGRSATDQRSLHQRTDKMPTCRSTPSWYLIAEDDLMISPKTQDFPAERMNATVQKSIPTIRRSSQRRIKSSA